MKFTWQRVGAFLAIIGLGIIGLMVADQYNFLGGRKTTETASIGMGDNPDTASVTIHQNTPAPTLQKKKQLR